MKFWDRSSFTSNDSRTLQAKPHFAICRGQSFQHSHGHHHVFEVQSSSFNFNQYFILSEHHVLSCQKVYVIDTVFSSLIGIDKP